MQRNKLFNHVYMQHNKLFNHEIVEIFFVN